MRLFRRAYEVNPYPVNDRVTFRNIDKTLTLEVRAESAVIVGNLNKVNKRLNAITDETTEEDKASVARAFANALFGEDQAGKLMDFYGGDALTVITACGRYFQERLSKVIAKAQKRA